MVRHGYYLAREKQELGDPELSAEARAAWLSLWVTPMKHAGRYDGASVYQREDGTWARVLIVEDFFTESFRVHVRSFARTG